MFSQIFKAYKPHTIKDDEQENHVQGNPQLCATCWWRREGGVTCDAFPEGIPTGILLGAVDHTARYDEDGVDDGGLTYTRNPDI